MIDLRETLRKEIYKLNVGDEFVDKEGEKRVVTKKEYRMNREMIFMYEQTFN